MYFLKMPGDVPADVGPPRPNVPMSELPGNPLLLLDMIGWSMLMYILYSMLIYIYICWFLTSMCSMKKEHGWQCYAHACPEQPTVLQALPDTPPPLPPPSMPPENDEGRTVYYLGIILWIIMVYYIWCSVPSMRGIGLVQCSIPLQEDVRTMNLMRYTL